MLEGWFSPENMETLLGEYFTNSEGEEAIDFRVIAFAPGSEQYGATASEENLIVKPLKVKIFNSEKVDECGNAELLVDVTTDYDGRQRADNLEYVIPEEGEPQAMVIPALKVTSNKGADCALVTYAEYREEICMDLKTSDYGDYSHSESYYGSYDYEYGYSYDGSYGYDYGERSTSDYDYENGMSKDDEDMQDYDYGSGHHHC